MLFLSMTPQLFVMLPYYRMTRSFSFEQLLRALVPFNILVAYMFLTYAICLSSDAGGVPRGWSPDEAMEEHGVALTADHRVRNHAQFMRFLVAVSVCGAYMLFMITLRVGDWWNTDWYLTRPSNSETVMIVLNYVIGVPPVAMTSLMMWYQMYLLSINATTIETHEQERVTRLIRRGQIPYIEYPFDVGLWRNVTDVMGNNVLTWLWPFSEPVHDGLSFSTCQAYPEAQFLWPPRDPRTIRRRQRPEPTSPFTYGHEQLNPALQPSNSLLSPAELGRRSQYTLNGPPDDDDDDESDWGEFSHPGSRVRVRRGSEGYEIQMPVYNRMHQEIQATPDLDLAELHQRPSSALERDDARNELQRDHYVTDSDEQSPKIINVGADIEGESDSTSANHLFRRHIVQDALSYR
ncbi:protein S-acyltransferase [Malassezia yamatoensis]|uniref:Protein S-acyltransferase n=1 Tax=Malassezia yamatoensis TaxID=253288 RepID=A0AAJ5YSK2_9BASI|nr:protein S-acyltransferase [Malassezia yamatoensis]